MSVKVQIEFSDGSRRTLEAANKVQADALLFALYYNCYIMYKGSVIFSRNVRDAYIEEDE